jgi:hypothetical protein
MIRASFSNWLLRLNKPVLYATLVAALTCVIASAQPPAPYREAAKATVPSSAGGSWVVVAYEDERARTTEIGPEAENRLAPVKLCFSRAQTQTEDCQEVGERGAGQRRKFVLVSELNPVALTPVPSGPWGALLIAESPMVSDVLYQASLWVFDPSRKTFRNALPETLTTMDGEWKVIDDPKAVDAGLFVIARSVWKYESGETHYSKHHYRISVYRFDPSTLSYRLLTQYVTQARYPSLDEIDRQDVQVIEAELTRIRQAVSRQK